jgi:hypothetical protein
MASHKLESSVQDGVGWVSRPCSHESGDCAPSPELCARQIFLRLLMPKMKLENKIISTLSGYCRTPTFHNKVSVILRVPSTFPTLTTPKIQGSGRVYRSNQESEIEF